MSRFAILFLVLCSCQAFGLEPADFESEIAQVKKLFPEYPEQPELKVIGLADSLEACSVKLKSTPRWVLKRVEPVSQFLNTREHLEQLDRLKEAEEAMKLPEDKRREKMDLIDSRIEIWLVKNLPEGKDIKPLLGQDPSPASSEVLEIFNLGSVNGVSFFAKLTLKDAYRVQKALKLKDGDNLIEADIRLVQKNGFISYVIFSERDSAIPQLEKAIADKHPERAELLKILYRIKFLKNIDSLLLQSKSEDVEIAITAKNLLINAKDKYLFDHYRNWLEQDAGKINTCELLTVYGSFTWDRAPEQLLDKILATPTGFYEYRKAFEMKRKNTGNPVSPLFAAAEQEIRFNAVKKDAESAKKCEKCIDLVLNYGDPDAAALVGIGLTQDISKCGVPEKIMALGIRILKGLPDNRGSKMLWAISTSPKIKGIEKERLKEIVKAIIEETKKTDDK